MKKYIPGAVLTVYRRLFTVIFTGNKSNPYPAGTESVQPLLQV